MAGNSDSEAGMEAGNGLGLGERGWELALRRLTVKYHFLKHESCFLK